MCERSPLLHYRLLVCCSLTLFESVNLTYGLSRTLEHSVSKVNGQFRRIKCGSTSCRYLHIKFSPTASQVQAASQTTSLERSYAV